MIIDDDIYIYIYIYIYIKHFNGINKCKNKRCGVCNIIIGQLYIFKDSKETFNINKNLTCNLKNVIYIIECGNCKETFIGCTKNFINRISLHKSNIKIEINWKLFVSKYIFEYSHGLFKTMPIFQTGNYNLIQIKEKDFIEKYKPTINKI